MPDQVPEPVKNARSAVLLEMTARHSEAFRRYYEGRPQELLLEETTELDGKTVFVGHTREYVRGYVEAEGHFPGEIVVGASFIKNSENNE